MEFVKDQLPSAIISGVIGVVIEKYVLGHNLSANDKFVGISMPKYGSTLLTVGAGSMIGGALSNMGGKYLGPVKQFSKPIVGGLAVTGLNYLDKSNTSMINSFALGVGSIYGGQLIDNNFIKKKALNLTPK